MTAEDRMERAWRVILYCLTALLVSGVLLLISSIVARAHDHDHPELDEWYATLMQPDQPNIRCCGETDAYWCDDYFAKNGKAYCRITDDRKISGRPEVPVGTVIEIPTHKLKHDQGNPTGHAVVFGKPTFGGEFHVYCFVQGGGV